MLRTTGVERGLIGPREPARLWDRHLLNCAVIAPAFPAGAAVIDVGSGAGLPGIPLALARPDLSIQLVEPMQRRVDFLSDVLARLSLDRVSVVRARAEELAGAVAADVVTARALAPLDRVVRWCLPLVRPGGVLLAIKGARAADELTSTAGSLAQLGAASWSLQTYGVGVVDPAVQLVQVVRSGSTAR